MTCETDKNGTQRWHNDGELHNSNGPAVVWEDGTKMWCWHGKLHREDGPAYMDPTNDEAEWWLHGELHRDDGPALYSNGTQKWYQKGLLHRTDGPAVITTKGTEEFWLKGIFCASHTHFNWTLAGLKELVK